MNAATRVVVGRSMGAAAAAGAVGGIVWVLLDGWGELLLREWVVHNAVAALGFGAIAWFVLPSQPRNGAVWVSAWAALFGGLFVASAGMRFQFAADLGLSAQDMLEAVPAELPVGMAVAIMVSTWFFVPTLLPLNLGLILFPDGSPPSPRWRWAIWGSISSAVVISLGMMWLLRPSSIVPYGAAQELSDFLGGGVGLVIAVGFALEFAMVFVGVVAMIVRYRRSTGVVRQQFRWVMWGVSVGAVFILYWILAGLLTGEDPRWPFLLTLIAVIGSYGVAIGKYRLYDVDVVISRTLVYGTLAVFIGAVYVGIVVGIGYLIGSQDEPNTWLGIVATVVIAIAFQPLRRRLQQVANRIVYGRRATPYEVLSSFSQRLSAVDPSVLAQVAKSLAGGTTADSASIWVARAGALQCIAAWPEIPENGEDPSSVSAPVIYHGEELGRVRLEVPPGQPFPPTDHRLLDHVAAGLGLALRNMQLTEDLKGRVEELAASRRRIVSVQDETRHKLERDLHDGAQQRLVALKIKLGIGSSLADKDGLDDIRTMIETVRDETDRTIESVRDFARGIYPPLLEAEGLARALTAQARSMPIPVSVQAVGLGRYSKEQEATVYFCVLEALQNAMKHSEASSVQVRLADDDGLLTFVVHDDGVGFVWNDGPASGLVNITDRVEALGGVLEVTSAPGRGTEIAGSLPLAELVAR